MNRRLLVLVGAAACNLSLPPLADGPRTVPTTGSVFADVPAVMPSDLDVLDDGSVAVLDGYAGRVFRWSAAGEPLPTLSGPGFKGGVRLAPVATGEGFWITVPDGGSLRRVLPDGTIHGRVQIEGAVDVLDRGTEIVVGRREGGVAWLDPKTGEVLGEASEDVDGQTLGAIAAITPAPAGGLLAVDTLGHKIHRFDTSNIPRSWIGHFGMWIGTMSKPKSVATGPGDTLLVADSSLRSVQLFERDGRALGALSLDGEIFQPTHPMQAVASGDRIYVLDAIGNTVEEPARVWALDLAPSDLETARDLLTLRHLRHALVDAKAVHKAAGEEQLCRQCHDGVVNDDRRVWDPALRHHPCNVIPDREVPAFFPTDEDGAIRCGTCHSPHGTSDLAEVKYVDGEEARSHLVRHVPAEGDLFTRLSRSDAGLCRGCHQDAAHDEALKHLGLEGGAHLVGPALERALRERDGETDLNVIIAGADGNCITCHSPHGAPRPKLLRDNTEGATCVSCHESSAGAGAHPMHGTDPSAKESAELPMGPEGGPTCLTCHDLVGGDVENLVRSTADGSNLCRACHDDGPNRGGHAGVEGDCLACHSPHQAARSDGLLARVGPAEDPLACRSCHDDIGGFGHPIGAAEGDATCTTCHGVHEYDSVTPECGSCHEDQGAAASRGGHGQLGCSECHTPHAVETLARADTDPRSRRCLSCHGPGGDAKTVEVWQHDARVFAGEGTRWEPLQGLLLVNPDGSPAGAKQGGDLACVTCHMVHGPNADEPGDSLRRPGWEEPCAACHGSDARRMYRWYHDAERRKEGAE